MAAYRVLRPFLLGGRRRAPGAEIELTPRQARYLLLDGRIERVPPASPDSAADAGAPPVAEAEDSKPAETATAATAEPKPAPPRRRGKKAG